MCIDLLSFDTNYRATFEPHRCGKIHHCLSRLKSTSPSNCSRFHFDQRATSETAAAKTSDAAVTSVGQQTGHLAGATAQVDHTTGARLFRLVFQNVVTARFLFSHLGFDFTLAPVSQLPSYQHLHRGT